MVVLLGKAQKGEMDLKASLGSMERQPGILHKPMVRPRVLLRALEAALQARHVPLGRAIRRPAALAAQRAARRQAESVTLRGRVLLVEDNHINQKVAQCMLLAMGVTVDIANNGLEALASLQRMTYSLVLMDCQMPEMDGWTATRRIREMEAHRPDGRPALPIIALTANALKGDKERCLEAGMTDYLAKPVSKAALAKALQQHLLNPDTLQSPRVKPTSPGVSSPQVSSPRVFSPQVSLPPVLSPQVPSGETTPVAVQPGV